MPRRFLSSSGDLNLYLFTTFQLNSVLGLETSAVWSSELWRLRDIPLRSRLRKNIYAIEHFFRVYIASSKHEEGWENSRQLCKHSTTSRVFITLSPGAYVQNLGPLGISWRKQATICSGDLKEQEKWCCHLCKPHGGVLRGVLKNDVKTPAWERDWE